MTRQQTKYYIYKQSSLSQKVSYNTPIIRKLAGSDTEISDSIAILSYLGDMGLIPKKETDFILGLLDVLRLSHFATSEKTNEISKLGFMLPKEDETEDWLEDEEEDESG